MIVYCSVALSKDGYMDNSAPCRLTISTPQDWEAVKRLRCHFDAIMVGAETIRRDNPSLCIKEPAHELYRHSTCGKKQPLRKVTVSNTLDLPLDSRFFTEGEGEKIVITSAPHAEHLQGVAKVLTVSEISAANIVSALEREGIDSLFIEGGDKTLNMFFEEGYVDRFRLAINPTIEVGDHTAPKFTVDPSLYQDRPHQSLPDMGGMEVSEYNISGYDLERDRSFLRRAVEVSRQSPPSPTAYRVGSVVVTLAGEVFEGYTHQTSPTHHAEQEAIKRAKEAGADLRGATIYASMEPCSTRKSEPKSCSEIIIEEQFARVVFALYEPDAFVDCVGAERIRKSGIEVRVMGEFADQVREINKHILTQ